MCALRGYVPYPERIDKDVDATSEYPMQGPHIFSKQKVAAVARTGQYVTKCVYVRYRQHEDEPIFLNVDDSADFRYFGRLFSGEESLRGRRPSKFFKLPSTKLASLASYLVGQAMEHSLTRLNPGASPYFARKTQQIKGVA